MSDPSSQPAPSLPSVSAAMAAEHGKEAATSPPDPQEKDEATAGGPCIADAPDPAPSTIEPAAMIEAPPPQPLPDDAAVASNQSQKAAAVDGQHDTSATAKEEAVLPPAPHAPTLETPLVEEAARTEEQPSEPLQRQVKPSSSGVTPPPPMDSATHAPAATPKQTSSVSQAPPSDVAGQPQQTGPPDTPATLPPPPPPEPPLPHEKAAPASESGKQLPAPPQPQQQEQVAGAGGEASSSIHKDEDPVPAKEGAQKKSSRRLWDLLRDAVRFGRAKSAPLPDEKKPQREDSVSGVPPGDPANKEKEKDQDEAQKTRPPWRRKSLRRAGSQQVGGAVAAGEPERDAASRPVKKFQMVARLIQRLMSLYSRHRAPHKDDEPAGGPPATKTDPEKENEEQPPEMWIQEEKRLENILEEAFTKLLTTEYMYKRKEDHENEQHTDHHKNKKKKLLCSTKKKCLLTFSVFEPSSELKKQTMIYWWVAQFDLSYRQSSDSHPKSSGKRKKLDAESVLTELSDFGFLEPIKNYCCRRIHGCKVNPLVHWMLKRLARDDRFADLDEYGRPTSSRTTSSILCLTAEYRTMLYEMRRVEQTRKPSRTGSNTKGPEESTQAKKEPTKAVEKMETNDVASVEKNNLSATSLPKETEFEGQTQKTEANNVASMEKHYLSATSLSKKIEFEGKTQAPTKVEDIKGKQVILNIDAHVYPLSKHLFEHLGDCLNVLQLGQWRYHDYERTYMEVNGLESESLCAINKLKTIRYLSLRGLSRLSKLPYGIQNLKSLEILDLRGCQNLVTISSNDISPLKCLTHLDLTECYMLEHIGRGITSLTNLRVFKGFVFGPATQGKRGCRINDLKKLNKLQKLTISITTDANIRRGDLTYLKYLTNLQSLTITWSEVPGILENIKNRRDELLKVWTNFELPKGLEKLDLRCYPDKHYKLSKPNNLKKLYLRGGDVEDFDIDEQNSIETLRLRFLLKLTMKWNAIMSMLKKITHLEISIKDEKLLSKYMHSKNKDKKDELAKYIKREELELDIPKSSLDENGVWMTDYNEDDCQSTTKGSEDVKEKTERQASEMSKVPSLEGIEVPSTKHTTSMQDANKHIGKEDQVQTQEVL